MPANNPLQDLLRSGVNAGADWASGKLFGSDKANQQEIEEERARFNRINGNGPVNQAAALQRPGSWTEFFFGAPASTQTATAGGRPPVALLLVALALVGWFIWKKA